MSSSVKVAVRVRPFNSREIKHGATNVVTMDGKTTVLRNPADGEERTFTFDHSYTSFDTNDACYATQEHIFNDLGEEVLSNACQGYNTSIFAYGQTGSGKSYSMLGYGDEPGIIPRLCEALFARIEANQDPNVSHKVEVSFMEIYNEAVRDLLVPQTDAQGYKLRVRNHPKTGPYVEGLLRMAVQSHAEVQELMDEGSKSRTVAATAMNQTSSRSHAIFTLVFTTITKDPTSLVTAELVSKINLVDLAGSERAKKTGNTGVRLKEGASINQSLSTLGKVIFALSEQAKCKGKRKIFVPYRDSVLTWLLRESLGGNAKTIMLAAISPADINYEETLSTLRYADRAKAIQNVAVVNEDPNAKLIRELREEIDRLRALLGGGGSDGTERFQQAVELQTSVLTAEMEERDRQIEHLREELSVREGAIDKLRQREQMMSELTMSWEDKRRVTKDVMARKALDLQAHGISMKSLDGSHPALINLNEDPLMSECLVYVLKPGTNAIGHVGGGDDGEQDESKGDEEWTFIALEGINIEHRHCSFEVDVSGTVTLVPRDGECFVNGARVTEATVLADSYRIILGSNHVFRFAAVASRDAPLGAQVGLAGDQAARDAGTSRDDSGEGARGVGVTESQCGGESGLDWNFAVQELAEHANLVPVAHHGPTDAAEAHMEDTIESLVAQLAQQESTHRAELDSQRLEYERQLAELDASDAFTEAEKATLRSKAQSKLEAAEAVAQEEVASLRREVEDQKVRFARLRERHFREKVSLSQQRDQIAASILLVNEANGFARAMQRRTCFSLQLRPCLPDADPSQDLGEAGTEVMVEAVDEDEGTVAFFSHEEFADRVYAMREAYHARGLLPNPDHAAVASGFDPFSVHDEDVLVGVCQVYLQPLYYSSHIKWSSPVIAHSGRKLGTLAVELIPCMDDALRSTVGSPGGDAAQSSALPCFASEADYRDHLIHSGGSVSVTIRVTALHEFALRHYERLYVTFNMWDGATFRTADIDEPNSGTVDGGSCVLALNHEFHLSVDQVTPDFLDYLKEGFVAFQVWVHRLHVGGSSDVGTDVSGSLPESVATTEQAFELSMRIEMDESGELSEERSALSADGDGTADAFVPVDVRSEPWNNPSVLFRLRAGRERRVHVRVTQQSDPQLCVEHWESVSLANIRLLLARGPPSSLATATHAPIALPIVARDASAATVMWQQGSQSHPLLCKPTRGKGSRVLATVLLALKLNKFPNVVTIAKEVAFRMYEHDADLLGPRAAQAAATLQRFQHLLHPVAVSPSTSPSTSGGFLSGSGPQQRTSGRLGARSQSPAGHMFMVSLQEESRPDADQHAAAVIEGYTDDVMQLDSVLEAEKLRQRMAVAQDMEQRHVETPFRRTTSGNRAHREALSRNTVKLDLLRHAAGVATESSGASPTDDAGFTASPRAQALQSPRNGECASPGTEPGAALGSPVVVASPRPGHSTTNLGLRSVQGPVRMVSRVNVRVEDVRPHDRDVHARRGYLQTLSKAGTWKRRYYALRIPYLYYYDHKEDIGAGLREKGAIDLTRAVYTLGQRDAAHPYTFGIITKSKVHLLEASSRRERAGWMQALDPSLTLDAQGDPSIPASRHIPVRSQPASPSLSTRVATGSTDGDGGGTSATVSSLSAASSPALAQRVSKRLHFGDEEGQEPEVTLQRSSASDPTLPRDVAHLQAMVIKLQARVQASKAKLSVRDQRIEELETQLLAQRKEHESLPSQYEARMRLLRDNLKLARQEGDSTLERERAKAANNAPELRRRLAILEETITAHVSQNQLLAAELDRQGKDFEAETRRLESVVERITMECDMLRKECNRLSIKEQYYQAKYELNPQQQAELDSHMAAHQDNVRLRLELQEAKKNYFMSYAIGVKMNQMMNGVLLNVQISELYQEALDGNVSVNEWPQWISARFAEEAAAQREQKRRGQ